MRKSFPERKTQRRIDAEIRQEERDARTDEQQIARLKTLQGESKRERARLVERIAARKISTATGLRLAYELSAPIPSPESAA